MVSSSKHLTKIIIAFYIYFYCISAIINVNKGGFMKKLSLIICLIFISTLVFSQRIFVENPELVNTNDEMQEVIKEIVILKLQGMGYDVVLDTLKNVDYTIKIKIIRFEDTRAYFGINLFKDDALLRGIQNIITDEDKLDIFISRLLLSVMNAKNLEDTKLYGNTIAEEDVISNIEEKFITRFGLSIGAHLGTVETISPDYHYLPVHFDIGVNFFKPDYFISLNCLSIVQAAGIKVGMYKIRSRNLNSFYYGGSFGVGVFYGPYYVSNTTTGTQYTDLSPFLTPSLGFAFGHLFNRTSSISLKPELEISFQYRKSPDVQIISSANFYLTVIF